MFKALVIRKDEAGYHSKLEELDESELPDAEVQLEVAYSTLNYKDGLALCGKSPVVRKFPMVAGVDLVGQVTASKSPEFSVGDWVLLNGWGVGETHWGGLAEKASLRSDWLIPLPQGLSPRETMAIGTAGYTAMLCIMALEQKGVRPDTGEVLVTGAGGGVGGFAVSLLSGLGYRVQAVTGRPEEEPYLKSLGAQGVLPRSEFERPGKPLAKERWAAAIDVVGGHTLANVCASMRYEGVVAACGLAGGLEFPSTVAPFILRGVSLLGVDSVMRNRADRISAWRRLAQDLNRSHLELLCTEIGLEQALGTAQALLDGRVRGRVLVKIRQ